jgi:hypothetical protein
VRRAAGVVALALVVTVGTAAGWTARPDDLPPPVFGIVQRAGILRVSIGGQWEVLETDTHMPDGLTGISCNTVTGQLTVTMLPVDKVLTAGVWPDEAYAGRFEAGPSAGLDKLIIIIRDPASHVAVNCNSTSLRLSSSNWFVWMQGWVEQVTPSTSAEPTLPSTAPPTTPPTTPATTQPTTPPTSESPTPPPIG